MSGVQRIINAKVYMETDRKKAAVLKANTPEARAKITVKDYPTKKANSKKKK